jgi:hypothetical protein
MFYKWIEGQEVEDEKIIYWNVRLIDSVGCSREWTMNMIKVHNLSVSNKQVRVCLALNGIVKS